jgi:hypothetical protein
MADAYIGLGQVDEALAVLRKAKGLNDDPARQEEIENAIRQIEESKKQEN